MQDARINHVVETNQNSTYEIRSRNPKNEPKPIFDSAKNSIEHWEVMELEMSHDIIYPIKAQLPLASPNSLFSNVIGLFTNARKRVTRFLEVYDQDNE